LTALWKPNRELDDTAQVVDEDFDRYATEMLKSIDAILLGRVTYQLFADYWPTDETKTRLLTRKL
jgi:dihydrofolate reductase